MRQVFNWLLIPLCSLVIVSCGDKENDEPDIPTRDVAQNIVGTWLLSTSDSENWISYDITESSRINAEIAQSGYYGTGTGYYSIENDKFSGSYTTDRSMTFYVDWIVTNIKPFEIALKIYDDNTLVGDAAIYRVVSRPEVETGSSFTPDYRGVCGSGNVSNFRTLDNTIAEIDPDSGEISGKTEGVTFATFSTPNGTAAIKITVSDKIKSFSELLVGTWVYDNPAEKTWERYTFADNGFVSLQWATYDDVYHLDESAQGTYSIEDQTVSFSITIPQGQMNMRMVTESINELNWTYSVYDGTHMTGKYTIQRVLESVTLSPQGSRRPNYRALVGAAEILSYDSHNKAVATVSSTGEITAKAKGRTYIDVTTSQGTGVVEVNVDSGAITVAFEDCIGKGISKVYEILGDKPTDENGTAIKRRLYLNQMCVQLCIG